MKKRKILYCRSYGGIYIVDLTNELSKAYEVYAAYAVRAQTPKDYTAYFNEKCCQCRCWRLCV